MSAVAMLLSVCGQHERHNTTVTTATTTTHEPHHNAPASSVARPVVRRAHIRSVNERSGDAAERLRSARATQHHRHHSDHDDAHGDVTHAPMPSVARPVVRRAHIRSVNERSGDAAERLRSSRATQHHRHHNNHDDTRVTQQRTGVERRASRRTPSSHPQCE
jgi:hypothetical protein